MDFLSPALDKLSADRRCFRSGTEPDLEHGDDRGHCQPTTRPSCETAVPAAWQKAIDDSAVVTGGVSNVPRQYVVIERGRPGDNHDTFATVVDTRSGALTYLRPSVGGADGGTIAVGMGATMKAPPTSAGVLRVDALPPLTC